MNPDDQVGPEKVPESEEEVDDLEATDEEGGTVKGGILPLRKAGGKQDSV